MKTNKLVITLLSIIAINLSIVSLHLLEFVPKEVKASEVQTNTYENNSIVYELSEEQLEYIGLNLIDSDYIIQRILYCIDASTIRNNKIYTYCNN